MAEWQGVGLKIDCLKSTRVRSPAKSASSPSGAVWCSGMHLGQGRRDGGLHNHWSVIQPVVSADNPTVSHPHITSLPLRGTGYSPHPGVPKFKKVTGQNSLRVPCPWTRNCPSLKKFKKMYGYQLVYFNDVICPKTGSSPLKIS